MSLLKVAGLQKRYKARSVVHITGVDYPWIKYSQITGRDYVAGAMENTTATIHQESAQQDARELIDGKLPGKAPLPMNYFTSGLVIM